jgi:hypothetical protein
MSKALHILARAATKGARKEDLIELVAYLSLKAIHFAWHRIKKWRKKK